LIESELFGHERGSFSGAHSRHKGLFEQAHGGTLFLDEVTEMDLQLQTKLLRVLETKEFRRLGSEQSITVDVRFLSATNRSPERAVSEGKLREDLYYRLAQFPVRVPPLRQRGGDIAGLAQYFLNMLNEKHTTTISFSSAALDALGSNSWPGNVRELKNYVERAYIMSNAVIDVADLPESISPSPQLGEQDDAVANISIPPGLALADTERMLILACLERNQGDKKAAAEELGVSLKTLYNRLRDYESDTPKPDTVPQNTESDS
jgi:DNA-binding NtrC family response regulator